MHPVPELSDEVLYEKPLDHSDFDLPSMSSSDDSWEAMFRAERRLRGALQQKLALLGGDTTSSVPRERRQSMQQQQQQQTEGLVEDFEGGVDINDISSILEDKDDFGLLASTSSPSPMFEDESSREKVDLLAIAALNDKEKETTDDEGDHVAEDDDEDHHQQDQGKESAAEGTLQVMVESDEQYEEQASPESKERENMQNVIKEQQEVLTYCHLL
jgi:hypothetical protein